MSIVFFSRIIPEKISQQVREANKHSMQEAAISFQNKLLEGISLATDEEIRIVNVIPISSYPKHSMIKSVDSFPFVYKENIGAWNIGFNNRSLIKSHNIRTNLKSFLKTCSDCDKFIVYSPTDYYLDLVRKIKTINKKSKITMIVPDLPKFVNLKQKHSLKEWAYNFFTVRQFEKSKNRIDAMVFMTEQTSDYLSWNKPYCVVEGVAEGVSRETRINRDIKTIVYTGTTHRRFGLPNLVQAFELIPNEDIKLIVCGCGDYDAELEEICQKDKRICFKGVVTREEALAYQMSATVLVNPRQNNEEYTKYSFPSKTMEYLSSGRPVIAYKLDGIPQEYDPFIIYVSDNSIQMLANTLIEVISWDEGVRDSFGKRARDFVIDNKNSVAQAKKILSLFERD